MTEQPNDAVIDKQDFVDLFSGVREILNVGNKGHARMITQRDLEDRAKRSAFLQGFQTESVKISDNVTYNRSMSLAATRTLHEMTNTMINKIVNDRLYGESDIETFAKFDDFLDRAYDYLKTAVQQTNADEIKKAEAAKENEEDVNKMCLTDEERANLTYFEAELISVECEQCGHWEDTSGSEQDYVDIECEECGADSSQLVPTTNVEGTLCANCGEGIADNDLWAGYYMVDTADTKHSMDMLCEDCGTKLFIEA